MTTHDAQEGRTMSPSSQQDDAALHELARRLVWWKDPDAALADQQRFLAQAMTDGSLIDLQYLRQVFGDDALRDVLANPPPGVFDRRSWAYWHVKFGLQPVPPMPLRRL